MTDDYGQSCFAVAEIISQLVAERPTAKLGLASGATPIPVYTELIRRHREKKLDFSRVRTVNLDEYLGLAPDSPQSYHSYMNQYFFNHINILKANTYVPSGLGDPAENAKELERKLYEGGPPDLQLLGIGTNGHIGFNEAGDSVIAHSHTAHLSDETIRANARYFQRLSDVPLMALTVGMRGILAAKQIVLLATGPAKAKAMAGLLSGSAVTPRNPATFLKLHQHVTVVIDKALAAGIGLPGRKEAP